MRELTLVVAYFPEMPKLTTVRLPEFTVTHFSHVLGSLNTGR